MSESGKSRDQFVPLFLAHQRGIYQYLLALVGRPQDAEDLLQETSVTLWEKFDDFEPGSNFYAWARKVAYNKVLNFRQLRRHSDQLLDPDVLDVIASQAGTDENRWTVFHKALQVCLSKLRDLDRALIQRRYRPDYDRQKVAEELSRPPNSVSKSLARIRRTLMECVHRHTGQAEKPGTTPNG